MIRAFLPLRAVTTGFQARRSWHGNGRAWIEVNGLDGPDGAARGRAVLDALRNEPGVKSASLNGPLSRVVVALDGDRASLDDLCRLADDAERRCREAGGSAAPARGRSLPGDGLLLATRGAMVGVSAAGLAVAVVGRAMRLPQAPVVDAVAAFTNYQPWVRRLLEDRIGSGATETVLSLVAIGARVATLSPVSLSVELTMQGIRAAECRAGARAWGHYEADLARHADQPQVHAPSRPAPSPAGPVERHGERMAFAQVIGAGLVGAITRNPLMASNAMVVAAPRAMRTSTESFAATLGQGLADQHAVLPLRPEGLRRLDKIDAVLVDPRVLCGEQVRVVRIHGAGDRELSEAWSKAQDLVAQPGLRPGWHPIPGARSEALIAPAHHPLASAVVAEARVSGAELVSLDSEILGDLRPAFDDIQPVAAVGDEARDEALDQALAAALTGLQQGGRTVAVLSSTAAQALCSADVALGIMPTGGGAPPWEADLLLADLAGAWQVLRALPTAREATQRGIAISVGASTLGALLMVPGVRGGRPAGPVTMGAAAGVVSGYLLARRVIRTPAPRPAPAYEWHAMSVEQVREVLPTPDSSGRGGEHGAASPNTFWQFAKAVRAELSDPLMPVLALCSAATAMLGSPVDAMMVSTVLVGNCMLAAAQQLQAENRLNRLLAQQAPPARTVRAADLPVGGTHAYCEVVADRLLPGDVIEVRSNEVVPADARVIEATDLEVDESSLTGESLSVDKQADATPGAELAERRCMLYAGTTVVAGTAVAVVTAVGPDTQARRATELASGELPVVGLQHQLSRLMSQAFPVSAGGGAAVGVLGMLRGGTLLQALGNAIAVAVAAIPEGMPLMATLAQHASAQRLSETGALVRVPRSMEALGRVEVVCFDKTGTLSENRLRVTRVHPVSGHSQDDVLRCATHAAPAPEGAAHAHATDEAIIEAAAKSPEAVRLSSEPDAHLPFRSGRAFSASVTGSELTLKGAPEVVLAACRPAVNGVDDTVTELAAAGLRVIAVARRRLNRQQVQAIQEDPDSIDELCGSGLSLVGFLGISDTPRAEAAQLLADLADRGVSIRLITGDHPVTATAIAAELGVPVIAGQVITGSEWNALSRNCQEHAVAERVIFARMSPENKVQIVQTLERSGRVCAMVGDGANDAAAIRAASVGLGVVSRGSDSAHATADVVLTEGRIGSLVDAIDEGRRLWRGVQAAVAGLLGGNAGEVIFSVIGTALSGNSPLNNRQLLLMNMLTDALPATAVAVSTPAGPVRRVGQGIDRGELMRAVAFRGAVTGAAATTSWLMASVTGRPQRASTVALIALVSTELGQTLVDSHAPLVLLTAAGSFAVFAASVSIPGISQLLGCTPVGPLGWAQATGSAGAAILAVAAANRLRQSRGSEPAPSPQADEHRDRAAVTAAEEHEDSELWHAAPYSDRLTASSMV